MHKDTVAAAFMTLLSLSVPAAADPPQDATSKSAAPGAAAKNEPAWKLNQRRQALMKEGTALLGQSRWAEARERFLQALELGSQPRTLLCVGFTEEQLGRLVRAKVMYEQARDDARTGKLEAEEHDATEALSALEPKIPRLTIGVPPDVEVKVSLDGAPIDAHTESAPLDPGRHLVTETAPGRETFIRYVDVEPGAKPIVEVVVPLSARPLEINPPPPPSPSSNAGPIALGVSGIVVAGIGDALVAVGAGSSGKATLVAGGTMVGLGLGAGVGALVWGLRSSGVPSTGSRPGQTNVSVAPLPGGCWATVQGRF